MRKILVGLMIFLTSSLVFASAPTRPNNYVSGTVISSAAVTANEVALYSYLQSGVDTYKAGSIAESSISPTAGILYSQLNLAGQILPTDINTTATSNIYTFSNIAVPYNLTINGTFNLGSENTSDILYDNGSSFVRKPIGTFGQVLTVATGSTLTWGQIPYIRVTNTQTQNTAGGSTTSGSKLAAILNTKNTDTNSLAFLCTGNGAPVVTCTAANELVLPAGTYEVSGKIPIVNTNYSADVVQVDLYNVTGTAVLVPGDSLFYGPSGPTLTPSIRGQFTLSTTSAVEVRYQVTTGLVTNGQGYPTNFGTEVYANFEFWKVA